MKKCLFVMLFVVAGLCSSLKAEERVLYSTLGIDFLVPGMNMQAVYAYDFVANRNLIGTETIVARWKEVRGTVGLATDADPVLNNETVKGIPFFGAHVTGVSIMGQLVDLGALVGRDFNAGENIAGVKCSIKLW